MECNIEKNAKNCACTYASCERRGKCCSCISYHKKRGELPGCLFPPEVEKTWDRSIRAFVNAYKNKV